MLRRILKFEMIYLTTNLTLLQLSIPDELRSRVMGTMSLRSELMPVGAFITGIDADLVGPKITTLIPGGIARLIAVTIFFTSPTVHEYHVVQTGKGIAATSPAWAG
ncbi:MAG: hypothetical protein JXA25_08160 [Anaerolineales bacterium]|nr:hypothetical protein [Anaerolineales bacterium]